MLTLLFLSLGWNFYKSFAASVPSSCIGLNDGEHVLKLKDGSYPLVKVQCSNEYIILNPNYEPNLQYYFQDYMMFHHGVAGPSNDYHVNWEQWYIPDDGNTEYIVSPDCSTCSSSSQRQIFGTKTAYMMTGTLFGCFWNLKGDHNYDMDFWSYECYKNTGKTNAIGDVERTVLGDDSEIDDWDNSGVCAFSVRAANREISATLDHDGCTGDIGSSVSDTTNTYHLKPSLGTEGSYCVCTKPSKTYMLNVNPSEYEQIEKKITIKQNIIQEEVSDTSIYYLYQTDFQYGTYRITKPGTYMIMEDIEFDFNADYENPNSDEAWWPHSDQSSIYEGAGSYHGSYFVGFWAGITIEASDVTLDLNGHTIAMSETFYYQQRWFTTIALQSQYFLPGQGIGMFGANPQFASNVVITNGIVGLSSHHGIHGHFNTNVTISDLQVRDFETHGIQFNGFENVFIKNVEVGPSSTSVYFRGEYGHSRTLLKRFQEVADLYPDTEIQFYGRDTTVTMQDIVDELKKQTDMAYYYVVEGREYDDDDASWQSASNLFLNPTGLPNGAAMYGIFLNTYGASVLTYNLYTSIYSNNVQLENVKIHDLKHSMKEYVRMQMPNSGNIYMNPLHAPYDAEQILASLDDLDNPTYKGTILTDAYLALNYLSEDWDLLQAQLLLKDGMLAWAMGDLDALGDFLIGCNIDVMIHSGKGISALRIDGVDGVKMNGIEIYDCEESTPLGTEQCGEYSMYVGQSDDHKGGGHFRQTQPMQIGFSGTMMQGITLNAAQNVEISNVFISDIESHHGAAFGISIWPANDVTLKGLILIENVVAGSQLEKGIYGYESRPNRAPEGCGLRLYKTYYTGGTTYETELTLDDDSEIHTICVDGHTSCLNSDSSWTMFGTYKDCTTDDADTSTDTNTDTDTSSNSNSNNSLSLSLSFHGIIYILTMSMIIVCIGAYICYASKTTTSKTSYSLLQTNIQSNEYNRL